MTASLSAVDQILLGKYPAKKHAENVAQYLRNLHPELTDGLIYLEGQKSMLHEDCDQEVPFRQRRNFFYLTGCDLPDCHVTYDFNNTELTLYIPPVDPSHVLWAGLPLFPDEALSKYDVDKVCLSMPDLRDNIAALSDTRSIFVIDSQVPKVPNYNGSLKKAIDECRVFKDSFEVALIRKANLVSEQAHHAAMSTVKSATNERDLQALFIQKSMAQGASKQAYSGIFGSGRAAATLHYVENDKPLSGKLNLLLDAGAEFENYASDITRTFPISGKFTTESRQIYDIVLKMQKETMAVCKEGKDWDEVHMLAHKIAIEGLLEIGLLKGGSVEEILESRTSCAFFPHGLGHYLGLDTHDTGGNPDYNDTDKMFCYLRKRGTLPANSVITVEPGLYFCEFIIKPYLEDPKHAKYIDIDVLDRYWEVGGVRIEDNILITADGYENLTSVVKDVDDMYTIINGLS